MVRIWYAIGTHAKGVGTVDRIDFSSAIPTWQIVKPKKDGEKPTRVRLILRYYDANHNRKGITKTFPISAVMGKDGVTLSDRKQRATLMAWIKELSARQEEELAAEAAKSSATGATSTVGEYVAAYIDTLEASGNISRHTVSDYRAIARRISEAFPGTHMRDLTTNDVQGWENGLTEGGLSPATVRKIHRVLAAAFKHAIAVRDLDWNPCEAVKQPKRNSPSPNSLTAEGVARLAMTLDLMEPSKLVTAAAIALFTGMREGEVCGLRWKEYDAARSTINVAEAIGRAPGGDYSKEPKTKSSRRAVPVAPQLAEMLERRRDHMRYELEEVGVALTSEQFGDLYVCGYVDGRFYSPVMLSRQWRGLSESLGLRGTQGRKITFHDLRHSFATRAIASGADIKSVAAVLGHSTITITADVYADADAEAKRRAMEAFSGEIAAHGAVRPYAELAGATRP